MVEVFAANEFLASEIEGLLSDAFQLSVALDDVPETRLEAFADLHGVLALAATQILDEADDLIKDLSAVALDVAHELLDLLIVGSVDHELVALLHEGVEFLGEFGVGEEGVADLDVAVVLVLRLLILAEELGDVLVGLQVLTLQSLQPPFGLLHIQLFKAHDEKE